MGRKEGKGEDEEVDLIAKERMFEETTQLEQDLIDRYNIERQKRENEKQILNEIFSRLTNPIKYKIKLYQLAVLVYIDQIVSLFENKFMFFRVKIEEKKTSFKIIKFHQNQIKLDIFSKESLHRTRSLIDHINSRARLSFVQLQSMHHHCKSHHDTPELFCEPYIHKGFRPINMPYSYYAKSLFYKHNETINAWSHYVGAMYTIYIAFTYDFSDPYSWPLLVCLITSTIMFISSATAHLMHQKSHYCHMTCFLCDFGGISFNAFGAALMQTYYSSPQWYFRLVEPYMLPFFGFQSALCILFNSIAQTNYKRPYPPIKRFLQFAPCGFLWGVTMLPMLLTLLFPDYDESTGAMLPQKVHYNYYFAHIFIFLMGAFFFAFDFPQRYFPGKLDFFGQGHNIFHLCIFAVVYLQLEGCYLDYQANRDLISRLRAAPTFSYCFGSLFVLVIYYFYLIRVFTKMIAHNFDEQGNLISKKKQADEVQVNFDLDFDKEEIK